MVLLLVAWGGHAWAGSRVAILGLEVVDNGSGIDPDATKAAKDVTTALRDRARTSPPYTLVAGGEKELIDEKLLNNCDSESPQCMATIGGELGADLLMYGKIEKGDNGQSYRITLKALTVGTKKQPFMTSEKLAAADPVHIAGVAKLLYSRLVASAVGGTVIVRANVDHGIVIIDDDMKGNLTNGQAQLSGIPEGRRTLAIEAGKDYQRYETQITVRGGETVTHQATLAENPKLGLGTTPSKDPLSVEGTVAKPKSNVWKPIFIGAAAVDIAAGLFATYEWRQGIKNGDNVTQGGAFATAVGHANANVTADDCNTTPVKNYADKTDKQYTAFQNACSNFKLQKIGWGVVGVASVAVVGSFVMAFLRDDNRTETITSSAKGHRKRRELTVTPVMSPNGGGATLQFDW